MVKPREGVGTFFCSFKRNRKFALLKLKNFLRENPTLLTRNGTSAAMLLSDHGW